MENAQKRAGFPPGTLVGDRYRIISALARGGFGVVYVAEQIATTRRVALKLLTAHLHALSVDRLLAEARLASRVNSEHIVQVYDAGIDSESSLVFVAMELLSGMTLAELVRSRGPVEPRETAEYLRQVALGLDKVHGVSAVDGRRAPIVHRDLKPANLFLTQREDGTAWLKILDFGAAKMLSDDTQTSSILRGTPEYMAYEQAGGGEITPATDIWALGLIAFYLLTGRPYWRGAQTESGRAQTFAEVLTLPLVPASERARELGATVELGPAFDDWFFGCVNREASERHPSAGEAASALARALDVAAGPVPAPSPFPAASDTLETPSAKGSSLNTQDMTGVAASSRKSPASRRVLTVALVSLLAINAAGALYLWTRARDPDGSRPGARDAGSSPGPRARENHAPTAGPVPLGAAPGMASATSSSEAPLPPAGSAPRQTAPRVASSRPRAAASPSPSPKAPGSSAASMTENSDVYDIR